MEEKNESLPDSASIKKVGQTPSSKETTVEISQKPISEIVL